MRKINTTKLKAVREKKNIYRASIADNRDISPSTVSSWFNRKSVPDFENLNKNGSQITINNSDNFKSDFIFPDNKSDDALLLSLYIDKNLIPKIVEKSNEDNKMPGEYVNELLKYILG